MRVPFRFVLGSVKETSTIFIDYAKQFTMPQLIEKEGVAANKSEGHLMMQQGGDKARRPGGGTQTQCHTEILLCSL